MIRKMEICDAWHVAKLAVCLWKGHAKDEMANEFECLAKEEDAVVFLKYHLSVPIGFAQCQLRHDYVEGTHSRPVGYLEGLYIQEEYRGRGYARELLAECEKWARARNCVEFASDCEWNNDTSLQFHLKAGFEEANRIICFTKKL